MFGTAFRMNSTGDQNVIGTIYNTESMFASSAFSTTPAAGAGFATQGTQLIATFLNVPSGVSLSVSLNNLEDYAGNPLSYDHAQLVPTAAGSTTNSSGVVTLSGSGNSFSGAAVWEVVHSNAGVIGAVSFNVYINYDANPLPGLGTATVTGNYAPVSTVTTASSVDPVPRFLNNPQSATTFTITSCQTNLLFPYVTNLAGFDTGLVISNTSLDPFSTPTQTGTCKINYYSVTGTNPTADTTLAAIPPGQQVVWSLSGGADAPYSIPAHGGFAGYIIAQCNFQYGHGFAFISDVGASKLAMGYLALILDGSKYGGRSGRSGVVSEPLEQ